MAENGLLILILGAAGLIAAVLLSVPFMLYSIKSSLETIEETLDDLREIDLESARRLWPGRNASAAQAPAAPENPVDDHSYDSQPPPAPQRVGPERSRLRNQAEQIRRRLQD